MRSAAELSGTAVTASIDLAIGCLRQNFRTAPGAAGWYHYLDDPNPGITASAVGLFTFGLAGGRFERAPEVVGYLTAQQRLSPDGCSGGWPVRTTNGFPIGEATAWVVRALSRPGAGLLAGDSLRLGVEWLRANQNVDFGWGSYLGQPSRVFHTALNMLALHESGAGGEALANGQRWLIDVQNAQTPGWGPLPGAQPTVVHTSVALMALARIPGALSTNTMRQTAEWLLERIEPGVHVERSTTVEEYDVPFTDGGAPAIFQNSLPHFAGPLALSAIFSTGVVDPLQPKLFQAVSGIIDTQLEGGHWELPRSPMRPSVWALWPFVSALSAARSAVLSTPRSKASLLYPGCAIVQSEDQAQDLTRRLLIQNALFDWLRSKWLTLVLWAVALVTTGIPIALLVTGRFSVNDFLTALILPALLMVLQYVWERRPRARAGAGGSG
ncbi:prenyltransferase/squalene oxidase repeat-containing protein [Streptomyces sp. NPDC060028]|uniref:prenyltransferase/squalene oxidase repeat-containing protein n=1 Tax=Streptomyces sp. NPDC060028 TaxID=3347041 RepID=UPI003697CA3E